MKKLLSATIALLLISDSFTAFSQEKEDTDKAPKQEKMTRAQAIEHAESARSSRASSSSRSSSSSRASSSAGVSYSSNYGDVSISAISASSSSQLSLRKSFNGESKKNEGSFDVDNSVRNIYLTIGGTVKEGKIVVKILLPDGTTSKDLTIDDTADMQFNQNIKIAEDSKKYYGSWKYMVESTKAVGHYSLSIHTR